MEEVYVDFSGGSMSPKASQVYSWKGQLKSSFEDVGIPLAGARSLRPCPQKAKDISGTDVESYLNDSFDFQKEKQSHFFKGENSSRKNLTDSYLPVY